MANSFFDSPNLPILLLGGAGVYALYKSDFFKGFGKATDAVGSTLQNVSGATDILQPIGQVGRSGAELIEVQFDIKKDKSLREASQETSIDTLAFKESAITLAEEQAKQEIVTAQETTKRKETSEKAKTTAIKTITNVPKEVARETAQVKSIASNVAKVATSVVTPQAKAVASTAKSIASTVAKAQTSTVKAIASKISSLVKKKSVR